MAIPEWILEWISKDRLVASKFRISRSYLKRKKRIELVSQETDNEGEIVRFHYVIHSPKYGRYNVTYEDGTYKCNCPFFKHRFICSHIFGVSQLTEIWPERESIFG